MDSTTMIVILGVVAGIAAGAFVFWWRRPRVDDSFYHFRCPKCKRRIRYMARQVGHKGRCSNCSGDVLFPPVAQSID